MFIVNFVVGLLIVIAGLLMLKFNFRIVRGFSRNNIFERRLGPGSTYLVFQVFTVLVMIYGLFMMFSLHDNLISVLFGPLADFFSERA